MKTVPFILASLVLIVFVGILAIKGSEAWRDHRLMKAAEPIIVLLEKYRQQHGVYPESLSEVGFEETDDVPIYYDKRDNGGAFILWFGKGLGESMAFKSKTGEWVECD